MYKLFIEVVDRHDPFKKKLSYAVTPCHGLHQKLFKLSTQEIVCKENLIRTTSENWETYRKQLLSRHTALTFLQTLNTPGNFERNFIVYFQAKTEVTVILN